MKLLITTNKREFEVDTDDIPTTNRGGYGIKGLLKLKKGEVVVNVLPTGH